MYTVCGPKARATALGNPLGVLVDLHLARQSVRDRLLYI